MRSREQIEDLATEFLSKRDGGGWTQDDQTRFTQWMEASTAHRVAVLRLEAGWSESRRLKVLSAGTSPELIPPKGAWRQSPFFDQQEAGTRDDTFSRATQGSVGPRKWSRSLGAVAASLLLVLGAGAYWGVYGGGERYSTPVGGIESVALSDGSSITLNTSSRLRVALSTRERRIDLERGEAFFEVAKDLSRPFVVRAGKQRVVAVGTKFSVSREDSSVKVVVSEGAVRLESDALPLQVERSGAGANVSLTAQTAIPLSAGTLARVKDGYLQVHSAAMPQVRDALTWREGYLTFHETPLAEVVEQFNRYNTHKIVIGDPSVAAIRINGAFRPRNYQVFVRLLTEGFYLHATSAEDQTTLTQ